MDPQLDEKSRSSSVGGNAPAADGTYHAMINESAVSASPRQLSLTFACGLYDRMVPLYTGEVRPEGIGLKFLVMDTPREIFDRMAGEHEFDASEYGSSDFIIRTSVGNCPFVAIPIFPSRMFRHGHIAINRKAGITKPKDLEGKRVGTPLYMQAAGIWLRGLLQHEYDVDLAKIHWVQGALNHAGRHGNPAPLPLRVSVPIEVNDTGKSLSELLDEGSIDATLGAGVPNSLRTNPDVQRLFPNYHEVEREYYQRTRIFPIMHIVVIRREIYEKYPFVAQSLYDAMCRSKQQAERVMRQSERLRYMLPWMHESLEEVDQVFGADPWPYGVEANRASLEALITYMYEQSLIAAPFSIDKLFVVQG